MRHRPFRPLSVLTTGLIAALSLAGSLLIPAHAAGSAADTSTDPAPRVVLKTSRGDITIELAVNKAPKTVANFLRYVDDGSYAGSVFHRVIPGFVAQGGGFTVEGERLPSYDPVANESDNGLSNRKGSIAMARTTHPDSATRQFYFNLQDNRHLDGKMRRPGYTVFGQVVDGDLTLERIAAVPTAAGDVPVETITILQAERVVPDAEPAPDASQTDAEQAAD